MRFLVAWLVLSWGTLSYGEWSHIDWGSANINPREPLAAIDRTSVQAALATLDKIVQKEGAGSPGVFYVNDLSPEVSQAAARVVADYCRERGYKIEVRSLPGNMHLLQPDEIPFTDSATLHNPEQGFFQFPNEMEKTVSRLTSRTRRFELTTSVTKLMDAFIVHQPKSRKVGEGAPYHLPSGRAVAKRTAVYEFLPERPESIPNFFQQPRLGEDVCTGGMGAL